MQDVTDSHLDKFQRWLVKLQCLAKKSANVVKLVHFGWGPVGFIDGTGDHANPIMDIRTSISIGLEGFSSGET